MSRPSHSQIWTAIDQLAARFDMTTSALAKVAGLDPTSFNRSKRFSPDPDVRPRWPSTESLSKVLDAALQRIPIEQREVVVMRELHQLSFTEIAEVLGEPVNTVKSRMYYGLKALHALASSHPQFHQIRHDLLS